MAFNYIGGKKLIAPKIVNFFPGNYSTYLEPFCGSAAVFFAKKKKVDMEVLNDVNSNIFTFFEVLRDQTEEFQGYLENLPYSFELYKKYLIKYRANNYKNKIEQAAVFWFLANCSFAGKIESGIARGKDKKRSHPLTLKNKVRDILRFRDRLRNVYLENEDFQAVIERYDGRNGLIYCDPPYINAEHYYKASENNKFGQENHIRLAEVLNKAKSKVILSYYLDELLKELYAGWNFIEIPTFKSSSNYNALKAQKCTELIITNFVPKNIQLELC